MRIYLILNSSLSLWLIIRLPPIIHPFGQFMMYDHSSISDHSLACRENVELVRSLTFDLRRTGCATLIVVV